MATLAQFGRNIRKIADRIDHNSLRLKRQVGYHVLANVVQATPIRTGQARYNWNVGFNRANRLTNTSGFKDFGRTGDWVGKMATSALAIARASETDSIYISNSLPYIGKLNRGGSPQASADYVRTAALTGAQVVRTTRILR